MKNQSFIDDLAVILVRDNVIKDAMGQTLRKDYKGRSKEAVNDFLLSEGLVDEAALLKALSEIYQVPAFDAEGYFFRHWLLRKFPKDFLLRNCIIPLRVLADDNILTVVASDPKDENLLPKLGEHVSYNISFLVGICPQIRTAISTFYDDPVTITDEYEAVPQEEREEKIALDIAKRMIDKTGRFE